jgi:hypothetical protein
MNLAKTLSFMLVSSTLTYNITLFVKLLIVILLTLNLYLSSSKQQMSLLRLCLLLSLTVFLFSQILYLINDLSSMCVQTSSLLIFSLLPFTFSLSYLTVVAFFMSSPPCCWAHFLVRLKNFILTSEWIFRLFKTERKCWNKKALRGISVLFWPNTETCCVTWRCLVSSHKSHAVDADSAF